MSIFNKVLAVVFVLVLGGCVSQIDDIEVPQAEEKMVMFCFLNPSDTVIEVYVTTSQPIYDTIYNDAPPVEDAVVTISDGSSSTVIPYDPFSERYQLSASQFPIISGKTYILKAENTKFSVSGSTTVPGATPDFDISRSEIIKKVVSSDTQYTPNVRVEWNDPASERNFYRVRSRIAMEFAADSMFPSTRDTVPIFLAKTFDMYNDEDNNGGTFVARANNITGAGFYTIGSRIQNFEILVTMIHCDEHYYQYHNSLNNRDGSPFSQPNLIYKNVDGGLGVVGSFTMEDKSKK